MPASARTSPLRGSSAATPPRRPARADHRRLLEAACRSSSAPPGAARGRARARTRLPATSSPPGRPRRRCSKASSSPVWPTGQSAREAARVERPSLLARLLRLHAPGDRVRDPHERRGARVGAGPSASTLPSRESSVARTRGRARCAREPLALAQLGEHEPRRPTPLARRRPARASSPRRLAEHARVDDRSARSPRRRPRPRGRRPRCAVSVAVAPPRGRRRAGSAERIAVRRASSVSSPCIARRSPRSHASREVAGRALSTATRWTRPDQGAGDQGQAASPPRAGSARWVRRRRRSEGMLFTGRGPLLDGPALDAYPRSLACLGP